MESFGIGATDMATFRMNQASLTDAGFDFETKWWMVDGNTRPFLQSERSTTITNAHQLQLMAMDLSNNYTLSQSIDMGELTRPSGMWNTSTGFVPIGNSTTPFYGSLYGNGNSVINLVIKRPGTDYVGLFGYIGGGQVQNVSLSGGSVTGANYVGGLAGYGGGKHHHSSRRGE